MYQSKIKITLLIIFLSLTFYIKAKDAYVLSYFGGSEGKEALHLAYSYDALHWVPLNNNKPILLATLGNKSIRDPYLFRKEDGKFVLLSTDSWKSEHIILWDTEDLIHFKNERILRTNAAGQHAWAPECVYDSKTKQYIIYWSGDIIYSNTTLDFKSLNPHEKFFDPGYACIDATIIANNGTNYLFFKDERGENQETTKFKALHVSTSKTLAPGSFQVSSSKYITDHLVEGPACIKSLTENKWYLFYDYFMRGGIWGCSFTTNLDTNNWIKMDTKEFSLPEGVRHGNAIRVTETELKKIIDFY